MHAYTSVLNVGVVSTAKLGTLRDGAKSELAQRIDHYTPELAEKSEYPNHAQKCLFLQSGACFALNGS
jgi:hypothetical protein